MLADSHFMAKKTLGWLVLIYTQHKVLSKAGHAPLMQMSILWSYLQKPLFAI